MAKRKTYPGTIETRRNSRRVILYAGGKRHAFTLPGASEKQARVFARKKHDELKAVAERQRLGLPGQSPVGEFVARFEAEKLPLLATSTEKSYRYSLSLFRAFLEVRGLALAVHEVRPGHIADFLFYARANPLAQGRETVSNRTVERHRAVLSSLFSFAETLDLIDFSPVRKVKPPKVDGRDPVILSDDQYEALLSATDENPMLRLYTLVLGETGMRSGSEVLWLQWEDVDLDGGFLRIVSGRHDHRTKSGAGRWVPMTARLVSAMREHFRAFRFSHHQSPWVFYHLQRLRHAEAGDRLKTLYRAFNNAADRAQLPAGFRQHDLRHRRVTTWLAIGKNPVHVKEAMGHSDLRVTMGYTHLAREHLRSLVDEGTAPRQHETG